MTKSISSSDDIGQVKVDDIIMGIGKGSSKKSAEQEAAKEALKKQAK